MLDYMYNQRSKMANCPLLSCPLSTFYAIFTLPSAAKRKRFSGSFLCISNVLYIYFSIKALQMAYNVWFYEKNGVKNGKFVRFRKNFNFFFICAIFTLPPEARGKKFPWSFLWNYDIMDIDRYVTLVHQF